MSRQENNRNMIPQRRGHGDEFSCCESKLSDHIDRQIRATLKAYQLAERIRMGGKW